MRTMLFFLATLLCVTVYGDPPETAPAPPDQIARSFLTHLENAEVAQAIKLWDERSINDKLKTRLEKMSSKVRDFGGISRVDVGTCEQRRIDAFEKKTGEKIDVVPVEIICGNANLFLAVFSIRKVNGQYRIFELESLKEWGGTHSLDEELGYQH